MGLHQRGTHTTAWFFHNCDEDLRAVDQVDQEYAFEQSILMGVWADVTMIHERRCGWVSSSAQHSLTLEVQDDGRGLVRDPSSQRLGLKGMERRAALIGASMSIESTLGKGTVVRTLAAMTGKGRFSRF